MVWPFKRRDGEDEGPAAPAEPVTAEPVASLPADPGWRSLPPIAPATPVMTTLVQRQALVDSLATWRAPELSLAPLGHALDPDGPPGRIGTTITESIPSSAEVQPAAGPPPLSYVQRAAAPASSVRRWTPPSTPTLTSYPFPPPAPPPPSPSPTYLHTAPQPPIPTLQLEALAMPAPVADTPPPGDAPPGDPQGADAPLVGDAEPITPLMPPTAESPTDESPPQAHEVDMPLAPGGGAASESEAPDSPAQTPASAAPPLPLSAPVQRSRDQRPVGLGRPISSVPFQAVPPPETVTPATSPSNALPVPPTTVQRAADPREEHEGPEEPVAPLLGSSALRPTLQRSADDDPAAEEPTSQAGLPLAQRAPAGTSDSTALPLFGDDAPAIAASPIEDTAPTAGATPLVDAAPLLGSTPLIDLPASPSSIDTTAAGGPATAGPATAETSLPLAPNAASGGASAGDSSGHAAALDVPPLAVASSVQRAPIGDADSMAPSSSPATSSVTAPRGDLALPLAATTAADPFRASAAPVAPLQVAPLLGGRPFAVATVQRASSTPTPSATSAGTTATTAATWTPAGGAAASAMLLSPEPGIYDPVLPISVWNGAAQPSWPGDHGDDAPPGDIVSTVQRSTGVDLSNVRIRRDTGPAVQRMEAKALTHDGEVHLPEERGSLGTTENRSLIAHELVHVAQQRTFGSSRPLEGSSGGHSLELQAQAMEHATSTGAPAPELHLHSHHAPVVQRAPFMSEPAPAPSPFTPDQVSTLLSLASDPPTQIEQVIQRQAEPAVQREEMAQSAPPPVAGPAAPEQDLEDLADKLFPRLRSRLRRELRSDRERHGNLTDLHR